MMIHPGIVLHQRGPMFYHAHFYSPWWGFPYNSAGYIFLWVPELWFKWIEGIIEDIIKHECIHSLLIQRGLPEEGLDELRQKYKGSPEFGWIFSEI